MKYLNRNWRKRMIYRHQREEMLRKKIKREAVQIKEIVRYQWKCFFSIHQNRHSWSPYCKNRKLNISVAKVLTFAKNGKCISENYVNNSSPLLWECKK